ncbi:MAG: MucB/RseB C-terminal domain-containing protein [Betaproteobacteria bacterium]
MRGVGFRFALVPGFALLQFCAGAALADTLPPAEGLAWLQRIATAARELNYIGIFVYQHGDHVETSRIAHFNDRTGELEKLEMLDGPVREIVRSNNETLTFDGEHRVVKREKRMLRKTFPALLPEQLSGLTEFYQLRKGEQERVAGFDTQALVLEPRDGFRYGHKWWMDAKTGLLLKARMFDENQHTIEQFMFTQVSIGAGVTRDSVRPSFDVGNPDWRSAPAGNDSSLPVDTGWTVKAEPPGFKKITEMKRVKAGSPVPVAHLVYSDGLAAVSIFIEPLPTARRFHEGASHQGTVNIYTRPLPDQLVTVLGEAPPLTIMQFAQAVTYRGQ